MHCQNDHPLWTLMAIWCIIAVVVIGIVMYHEKSKADDVPPGADIVTLLPEGTKESRLLRVVDKEAGVVCYIIQNDTMDFYSGLQCIPANETLPWFWREKLGIKAKGLF